MAMAVLFARNEELSNPISNISRLSYNYLALSGAEFVSKALTAVAFAFMARIFGPELYGQLEFSIANSLSVFFILSTAVWGRTVRGKSRKIERILVNYLSQFFRYVFFWNYCGFNYEFFLLFIRA